MNNMRSRISYRRSDEAWLGFELFLRERVEGRQVRTVCDIGGGANPVLPMNYIAEKSLDYTVLDISESELQKAPSDYHKIAADIASPDFNPDGKTFDLVFSKMLAEHVKNGQQFHRNIRKILSPNGIAVHFFPTLYAFPFVVNYITPEFISDRMLDIFAPRDRHQHGKFPAYYQWCRGPSQGQFSRLESVGLDVVEYIGFFGHAGYYRRLPGMRHVHEMLTRFLMKFPNPHLTSYSFMVVRKREEGA